MQSAFISGYLILAITCLITARYFNSKFGLRSKYGTQDSEKILGKRTTDTFTIVFGLPFHTWAAYLFAGRTLNLLNYSTKRIDWSRRFQSTGPTTTEVERIIAGSIFMNKDGDNRRRRHLMISPETWRDHPLYSHSFLAVRNDNNQRRRIRALQISSSSSAALGRRLSAEERHEEWEKYNDNQAEKKRTTRQQQQQKNTLWELRNCRPGRTASQRAGRKGATGGGDGGVFSLCAHIRQVITRRRPLRTSSIHNNNEQRKKKGKKKDTAYLFIIERVLQGGVVNRSSRGNPRGEGYLIQ